MDEAKKVKSNAMINAGLIGMMVGIVIYGVAKNNLGLAALIPLIIAFKLFNKPNQNEALEKLLRERNLK
ncbi:hypothetical protein PXH66_18770 [Synoicihabitans lomoniglobus]|uniref:FUSC family protein n=1 Tax=Synoicihabitans lomoniglobus TaxID=2909285 RepID=A0AAF0CNB7_9BACT|nr:hypothetical protein PXH66_18770 [Opitutaceae bacterium LMO-M01]